MAYTEVIAKIKQKNGGKFFLIDAEDIEYDGKSLIEVLKNIGSGNISSVIEIVDELPEATIDNLNQYKLLSSTNKLYKCISITIDNVVTYKFEEIKFDGAGSNTDVSTIIEVVSSLPEATVDNLDQYKLIRATNQLYKCMSIVDDEGNITYEFKEIKFATDGDSIDTSVIIEIVASLPEATVENLDQYKLVKSTNRLYKCISINTDGVITYKFDEIKFAAGVDSSSVIEIVDELPEATIDNLNQYKLLSSTNKLYKCIYTNINGAITYKFNEIKFAGSGDVDSSNIIEIVDSLPAATIDILNQYKLIRQNGSLYKCVFEVDDQYPDNFIYRWKKIEFAGGDTTIDDESISTTTTYSSNKIDNDFVLKSNVLTLNNETVYVPTKDYHPATKIYVDTAIKNLGSLLTPKGILDSVDKLPADAVAGDTYFIPIKDNNNFSMHVKLADGNWLEIATTELKLSNYFTKEEITALLSMRIGFGDVLPEPSKDYLNQLYLNTTDVNMYKCIFTQDEAEEIGEEADGEEQELSGTYSWKKINNNAKSYYVGNITPENKDILWFDTSDSKKTLIKLYNYILDKWEILNDSSDAKIDIRPSEINGNIIVNGVELTILKLDDFMDKTTFASIVQEGSVKRSDIAGMVECLITNTIPDVYLGANHDCIPGLYTRPINEADQPAIEYREFPNVTPGWEDQVESLTEINSNVIVNIKKTVEQHDVVDLPIRSFNITEDYALNHSNNVNVTSDYSEIKNIYTIQPEPEKNSDNLYECDLSQFEIIDGIEVNN